MPLHLQLPCIAPFGLAREFIGRFLRFCDGPRFQTSGRAQIEVQKSRMFPRMPDDPGFCRREGQAAGDKVREFFIFIAQRSTLELAMFRGTLHALGKMTPVAGSSHGTFMTMRTRRQQIRPGRNQEIPRAIDRLEAGGSAGLDDDQKLTRRFPGLAQRAFKIGSGQLTRNV